jgi:hypothetical protein
MEAQSGQMASFIKGAHAIAARRQRLEGCLKLIASDPTFCRILFEEKLELLPALVAQNAGV